MVSLSSLQERTADSVPVHPAIEAASDLIAVAIDLTAADEVTTETMIAAVHQRSAEASEIKWVQTLLT
jgi:hypothetical protein